MENYTSTILVVDDDHNNLEVIIKMFEDRPYRIMYAPNGQRGYDVAVAELPDLIISDWAMPIMNGIDLTLKLKATRTTKDIPVVIATGVMTSAEDLQEALEAGAIEYIRKPFNALELRARVNAALILSQSMQQIREQNKEIQALLEKEKVLLQDQLDQKERELSIQALHSQEKQQLLAEMLEDLQKMGKAERIQEALSFKRLVKKLKGAIQDDQSEENFLRHFEGVHPHFFQLIHERNDTLTPNELKLCAYVKLGMNNKEVAQLSGVELGTVKSNINRLKKKLELSADDSLRQYIMNLS
ncbi:MAG: response regulator [Bacteroidota bacterium]